MDGGSLLPQTVTHIGRGDRRVCGLGVVGGEVEYTVIESLVLRISRGHSVDSVRPLVCFFVVISFRPWSTYLRERYTY